MEWQVSWWNCREKILNVPHLHTDSYGYYSQYLLFTRFFFSSRRRHTRFKCDWSSDVCSSDLPGPGGKPLYPESLGHPSTVSNRGASLLAPVAPACCKKARKDGAPSV